MGEATAVVAHVTSRDGTRIGYHRRGDGPPLVLVHGTRARTFGGTFDVCAAPDEVDREALQPGSVLGCVLWLVGRPLLDPADDEAGTFSLPWRRNG